MHSHIVFVLTTLTVLFHILWLPAQTEVVVPEKLTLKTAKSLLMRHNPMLLAERVNIDIEMADVVDAQKLSNPVFEVSSEGLNFTDSGPFFDDQEIYIAVKQEILTAGKRKKRTQLEQVDVEIASVVLENTVQLLNFRLKQAYYNVVLAQENLKLAQEVLDRFEDAVRLNRIRFEKGEISGGELRRVEAAQYRFYEDAISAEVRLENAQAQLLAVLGATAFDQKIEAVDGFEPQFRPPSLSELRDTSLRERKDLAVARAKISRAEKEIALQEARRIPNLIAFGGYRRNFGINGAVGGIQIPLTFFNRNQGKIARSKVQQTQQQQRAHLMEIEVLKEVQLALNELTGHQRRIQALETEYLDKARQSRDIAELAYRLGSASLIEFLEAQRTYQETSLLHNRALYDYQISRVKLELAIGRDF